MDAGFLNFHKGEDFTSDFLDNYGDNSESYDEGIDSNPYHLSWDSERELNGDIGLIPIPSQMDFLCPLSNSPPFREDINKIMSEWNQMDDFINPATFDLPQFIEEPELKPRLGGKRIDMENRRYVLEEENSSGSDDEDINVDVEDNKVDDFANKVDDEDINVDVETLSDNTSQPILEAGNLNSLLEQFEASESANLEIHNGQKIIENLFEPETSSQALLKAINSEPLFDIKAGDDSQLFALQDNSQLFPPQDNSQLFAPRDDSTDEVTKVLNCQDDLRVDVKILSLQNDLLSHQEDLKFLTPQDDASEYNIKYLTPHDDFTCITSPDDLFQTPQDDLKFPTSPNSGDDPDLGYLSPQENLKIEKGHDEIFHPEEDLKFVKPQDNLKVELNILTPQDDFTILSASDDFKILSPHKIVRCISPIKTPKKIKISNTNNDKSSETRKVGKSPSDSNSFEKPRRVPIKDHSNNKQILESLPQELIDRIRQSCKRKPVEIIPPIVHSKKKTIITLPPQKKIKTTIHTDHDYCSNNSHKDSGFSSCEEDDRSILKTQPTVKNADGKLMVSLLKTNTIKKKLNLEEYKKRLQNRSQNASERNSPALMIDEDENMRRLKHQEKLMQMAQELIEQQNNKKNPPSPIVQDVTPTLPSNVIMKTLVSVATNTNESWGHLQDIIQTIDNKIQPNSLISSIVEHLPKITSVISNDVEQAHDKTIVYLDKQLIKPKMNSVHTQTIFSSIEKKSLRARSDSTDSSSSSSSYSSYSSRSRTPSPVRRKNKDEMNAVEERRVIYVGRISNSTTREDLRKRFSKFGEITNVSVHFRRRADNYGFVTFCNKEDAFRALERGNDDSSFPEYDLSFGGRRLFCQTTYADLDNVHDNEVFWSPVTNSMIEIDTTFDALLKEAQAKIKKRQL